MKKRGVFLVLILVIFLILFFYFRYGFESKSDSQFTVNPILLKAVIKQGEVFNTSFEIVNLKERDVFYVEEISSENLIFLEKKEFKLENLEKEKIGINLNRANLSEGVYVGSLLVKNSFSGKFVPVILEIQTRDISFAINSNVNAKYKEIEKGRDTFTDINFFNLVDNGGLVYNVGVEYVIKNLKGEIVNSESETIEIGSKFSVTKTLPIPEKTPVGDYVFSIIVKQGDSVSTSSYLFKVVDKKKNFFFLDVSFFSLLVVIFLFFILLMVGYLFYERNKLFSKLGKHHDSQLRFYSKNLESQKKKMLVNAKSDKEKKKVLSEFRDAKKKIINEIKNQQKRQVSEFGKLRTSSDKKEIKQRLEKWDRETYPRAVEAAEINQNLKIKLGSLKNAYLEGYISRESYKKGESRIRSARRKLKRKSL